MKEYILQEISKDFVLEIKDKLEILMQWVRDNGGRISNIKVRQFIEKSLGIVSSNYTESGTELLYIPKNLIIFKESCINSETEPFLDKFMSRHSLFALYIMLEKKKANSFWEPYLSLLPIDFSTYPVFFTEKELGYLAGSSLLLFLENEKQYLLDDYKIIENQGLLTHKEFLEGRLLISSRLYSIKATKDASGLIPFADLFNHEFNCSTAWNYDFDKEGFVIETQDEYQRNNEICIDYGYKSNIKLLLGYGFALENNPYDEYIFDLKLKKNDSILNKKLQLSGSKTQFKLRKKTDDPCFLELMGFLRLRFCNSFDNIKNHQDANLNLKNISFLSKKNETKVIQYLLKICENSLQAFPTTYSQDLEKSLTNLTSNEKNCLFVVKGEKEVLLWGIKLCKIVLEIINTPNLDIGIASNSYMPYLNSVIFHNLL